MFRESKFIIYISADYDDLPPARPIDTVDVDVDVDDHEDVDGHEDPYADYSYPKPLAVIRESRELSIHCDSQAEVI